MHAHPIVSLRLILITGTIIYISTLFILVSLVIWSTGQAEQRLNRVSLSYEQLAITLDVKAAIGNHLITELGSIVGSNKNLSILPEPENIEKILQSLEQKIREEIELARSPDEAMNENNEFGAAKDITELYTRMLANIERERTLSRTLDTGSVARAFADNVINRDYRTLNSIVQSAVSDEQQEVESATAELSDWKAFLFNWGIIAVASITLISLLTAISVYRTIMRPLADLADGSRAFADGELNHRIPLTGPPELRSLSLRFNNMAHSLADHQKLLVEANEGLEETITQRTHELEEKASKIAEIDRTRRLFFAKIGHELRTPLTVILGETDVALQQKKASLPIYREALHHIAANGQFLKRRLEDFLAMARSEDGEVTMESAPCRLDNIIRDTVENASAYARSNGIHLNTEISETPVIVAGDTSWLQQGLLALIDNAVKFSPENGEVTIGLNCLDGMAIIDLCDKGPGVSEHDLPQLFKPYFQAKSGHALGGSGLGLSVAHWVTHRHNGRISASNRSPHGLHVCIELPIYDDRKYNDTIKLGAGEPSK